MLDRSIDIREQGGTETLYTVQGRHDQTVTLRGDGDGDEPEIALFDRSAIGDGSAFILPPAASRLPKESQVVWGKLTSALLAEDWKAARVAKVEVEEAERKLRKQREAGPALPFSPALFKLPQEDDDIADWRVADGAIDACATACA